MIQDIATNHVLDGRFTLKRKLGEGGYGAVYEGLQTSVKRRCAIKLMRSEHGPDRQMMVERFKAEALATSKLQHPNTVVIYDFGVDEAMDVLFLAMEFLGGHSLDDVLKEEHALPLDETLSIINQIAASLHHAHQRGIIHRDIKPHNIMVLERHPAKIKVIDFGIARVLREQTTESPMQTLTRTGMLLGTPHFMAPEQIRGEEVDGRADIYALGMCIYKMLSGRTPFSGASAVDIACQHLVDTPKPLSYYAPDLNLPEAFEMALLKSVAKKPDERFDDIVEFANTLTEAARYRVQWSVTGALNVQSMDNPETPAPRQLKGTEKLKQMANSAQLPAHTVQATPSPTAIDPTTEEIAQQLGSKPWVKPIVGIGALIGLILIGVAVGKLASTQKNVEPEATANLPVTKTQTPVAKVEPKVPAPKTASKAPEPEAEAKVTPKIEPKPETKPKITAAKADKKTSTGKISKIGKTGKIRPKPTSKPPKQTTQKPKPEAKPVVVETKPAPKPEPVKIKPKPAKSKENASHESYIPEG